MILTIGITMATATRTLLTIAVAIATPGHLIRTGTIITILTITTQ